MCITRFLVLIFDYYHIHLHRLIDSDIWKLVREKTGQKSGKQNFIFSGNWCAAFEALFLGLFLSLLPNLAGFML